LTEKVADRPASPYLLVARVVWLEVRRREEYLALFILMGLYLVFALGARLVGNAETESVALMLNMGLWLSGALAAVLTLVSAARLIPTEIEARTLYPLLAKPIRRSQVLIGKFLAATIAGWFCFLLFTLLTTMTWAAKFPLPGQDPLMLLQALVLQLLALALLASLSLFLSLIVPVAVAIVVSAVLYFGGTALFNVIRSLLDGTAAETIADWALYYLPHFSRLCLLQRFTDGGPCLLWSHWLYLALYSTVASLLLLAISSRLFERQRL